MSDDKKTGRVKEEEQALRRREFLKRGGLAIAHASMAATLLRSPLVKSALAAPLPASIDELRRELGAEGTLLLPGSAEFARGRKGFNLRINAPAPEGIVLCKTAQAVQKSVVWARENGVAIRMRSGGHSYEGFSQGPGLLIDTRLMNSISVDSQSGTGHIGAGAKLGQIYEALSRHGMAIPAGTCLTVGVAGVTTGGGYGMLSRKLGLSCDQLLSLQIVTADGRILDASAAENAQLFWACRGGGSGSFGVVTRLGFHLNPVNQVRVFTLHWRVGSAPEVLRAFQEWAVQVSDNLSSHLTLNATPTGLKSVRLSGQFTGTRAALESALRPLLGIGGLQSRTDVSMPFIKAVHHFAGSDNPPPVLFKAKSDFMKEPLSDEGIQTLLRSMRLVPGAVSVIFDNYGGAINRVASDATAFFHRRPTIACVQYYTQWSSPSATPQRLAGMRALYAAMRPHMSGGAYFNYCDLDLADWPRAYWGDNLERLKQVKRAFDGGNLFNHPQSISVT